MTIQEKVINIEEFGVDNKAHVLGEITDLLCEGTHRERDYYLVLVRALKVEGKRNYVTVILDKNKKSEDLISRKATVYVEGALVSSFNFNDTEAKHIYINPYNVVEVDKEIELDNHEEFYINYTLSNRVMLRGVVDNKSTVKYIESMGMSFTKFRIRSLSGDTFNCTLWDTVNSLEEIAEGMPIRIVGGINVLNKDIVLRHRRGSSDNLKSKENRTTYNILVQKIGMDLSQLD